MPFLILLTTICKLKDIIDYFFVIIITIIMHNYSSSSANAYKKWFCLPLCKLLFFVLTPQSPDFYLFEQKNEMRCPPLILIHSPVRTTQKPTMSSAIIIRKTKQRIIFNYIHTYTQSNCFTYYHQKRQAKKFHPHEYSIVQTYY